MLPTCVLDKCPGHQFSRRQTKDHFKDFSMSETSNRARRWSGDDPFADDNNGLYDQSNKPEFKYFMKRIQCPCWYCDNTNDPGGSYSFERDKKQILKGLKESKANHERRIRGVKSRERSVSIDGRWRWDKKALAQDQSYFFSKLPTELKMRIYKMLLVDESGKMDIMMRRHKNPSYDCFRLCAMPGIHTALLSTCRRM